MAAPADARALLAQQDIRYVLICSNDPTVGMMKAKYPDGLFAAIATGHVPDYLELVSAGSDGLLRVFAVKPQ